MPKVHPFNSIEREKAIALLLSPVKATTNATSDPAQQAQLKRLFFEGEHWQNGAGWMGPIPAQNDRAYNDAKEEIRRTFCSRNVVGEVVKRRRNGVLGREPAWSIATVREVSDEAPLTPEETVLLTEANAALTSWWDRRECTQLLREAHDRAALGEQFSLRIYVPRGLLDENPQSGQLEVPPGNLQQSLELIHVQITAPGQAGLIEDDKTRMKGAIYNEQDGDGAQTEIVFADGEVTKLRIFSKRDGAEAESLFEFALGGRLTIYEPRLEELITGQTIENQLAINLAKTLQNRHMIAANFLERIITDAMPPGEYVDDPNNPGKKVYKLRPFKLGSGTTNFLNAARYGGGKDENNQPVDVHYGKPEVHFREPGSNDAFIQGKRDPYQDILEECDQAHVLMGGDATASGESRKQARDAFKKHCEGVKAAIDPMGRWLLETVLLYAAGFAKRSVTFSECRADFNCIVDTGPRSADEQRADGEDVKAGHLSLETKMTRDGIEDPAAEMGRIHNEREQSLTTPERADVIETLTAAGATLESAAQVAGLDNEQLTALKPAPVTPPTPGLPPTGAPPTDPPQD